MESLELPRRGEGGQGVGTSPSWPGVRCGVSGECKVGKFCGFRSKLLKVKRSVGIV